MSSGNSVDCGEILLADSGEEADFVVLWSFSRSLSADTAFLSSWTVNVCDKSLHISRFSFSSVILSLFWVKEEFLMNIDTAVASLNSSAICSPLRGLKGLNFSSS